MKTLKDLPVGSIITYAGATIYNKPIKWMKLEDNHYGMNETTLIAKDIIKYMCVDAVESTNPDEDRKKLGNNRYIHSNIHQWLNSDKTSWYSDAHSSDQAPNKDNVWSGRNPYDNIPGFMNAWDRDFKEAILNTSLKVVKSSTDGGGMDTFNAKVFCLSRTEAGLGNESGADGTPFSYFDSVSRRKAVPTADAKANNDDSNDYAIWWLRTPDAYNSYYVRNVSSDGSLNSNIAYYGNNGVRPALNFPSSISISEKGNGEYELTFNTPPKISGQDQDLGNISDEINYKYTVLDENKDTLSIIERLNNKIISTKNNVESGSEFVIKLDKDIIYSLPIGQKNTLQIEVDDGTAKAFRNITFTRVNAAPTISGEDGDLGEINEEIEYEYTVNDPDQDILSIVEKLNNTIINSYNDVEPGESKVLKISKETMNSLEVGKENTITIDVSDESTTTTRKIIFTKKNNPTKIIGQEGHIGSRDDNLTYQYKVEELDTKDSYVVEEIINGITFNSRAGKGTNNYVLNIPNHIMEALNDNQDYDVIIKVKDNHGNIYKHTFSFTKVPYVLLKNEKIIQLQDKDGNNIYPVVKNKLPSSKKIIHVGKDNIGSTIWIKEV